MTLKPSGPGALSTGISLMMLSISSLVIGQQDFPSLHLRISKSEDQRPYGAGGKYPFYI